MGTFEPIGLNGCESWALVVELADGLRVRLPLDDWERLGVYRGQRVPVRPEGRPDEWLFVAEVVERPPAAWVELATRLRGVG